jgi:hypothetical protein
MRTEVTELESSVPAKQRDVSEHNMNKRIEKRKRRDELRREYDLSKLKGGVRGKYAARYRAGTNLVLLSPDVAEHFPNDRSVNAALRRLIPGLGKDRSARHTE